jgi:hydrogenase-4 component B
MYSILLLAIIAFPLLGLSLLGSRVTRRLGRRVGALSPLLPLGVSLLGPEISSHSVPWLMLNTELGLDTTGRVFLLLTSLLWLSAGVFALGYHQQDSRRDSFWAFFLVAMSGNLGLILAHDMVSYYLFFAVMSFASFGLIIHDGTSEVLRAGRVYLVLVVMGEILLFLGFLGAAEATDGYQFTEARQTLASAPTRGVVFGLLLCGFGVKAGLVPLHVWLPLAHPAAPTAASAVLSGAMIKAGLLGWLRIMPLGLDDFPSGGFIMMALGLVAMYGGVLIGVLQTHPKVILAYSSISQMGVMTLAVGA